MEPEVLQRLLGQMASTRILVVGDLIADEFLIGEVERISREAPVLILRHQQTRLAPGGAANAAANIAALGGQVEMLGIIGADGIGQDLLGALQAMGVATGGMVTDPARPTTTKTRISAQSNQSVTQQIVRVDRLSRAPITSEVEDAVLAAAAASLPTMDAVLVSDYGNGLLTARVREGILELARSLGKRVVVDAQGDLRDFQGVAAFTPNQPEAEAVVGFPIRDHESLLRAGNLILEETGAGAVLITRGAKGIALFERGRELREIPVFNRSEVFDVTGAGDTVVGTLTLALAGGASYFEATVLANLAASQVVRRFGTATTSPAELLEALERLTDNLPREALGA